jgi:hypothetical protein
MFSWVRLYRELMTDVTARAEQATDPSGWAALLKDDRKKIPGTQSCDLPGN